MPSLLAQLTQLDIDEVEVVIDHRTIEHDLNTLVTSNERAGLGISSLSPQAFNGCEACADCSGFCADCGSCCHGC